MVINNLLLDGNDFWPDSHLETDEELPEEIRAEDIFGDQEGQ